MAKRKRKSRAQRLENSQKSFIRKLKRRSKVVGIQFLLPILAALLVGIMFTGCGQQNSISEQTDSQNAADYQAKYLALAPAEGTFQGMMHIDSVDQDFQCVLTAKRVAETEKSTQSESPSDTVQIAKLSGRLIFPAVSNLSLDNYSNFQALLNPMGGISIITFTFGDYDPKNTQQEVLPYTVPGYSGDFGNLTGQLKNGVFTGTWFANAFGNVGTFNLKQVSSGSTNDSSSGTRL